MWSGRFRAVHVHNAVWPLPRGRMHVKESYHFSKHPSLRGRGGQDQTSNRSFLCRADVHQKSVAACIRISTTGVWSLPASPGKKTDQIDCERLAGLHQYALVRPSFIPLAPIRELRDLTRRRTHLQQRDQPHSPVAGDGQHRVGLGNEQCRRGHGPVHPEGLATTKLNRPEIFSDFAKGSLSRRKRRSASAAYAPDHGTLPIHAFRVTG